MGKSAEWADNLRILANWIGVKHFKLAAATDKKALISNTASR